MKGELYGSANGLISGNISLDLPRGGSCSLPQPGVFWPLLSGCSVSVSIASSSPRPPCPGGSLLFLGGIATSVADISAIISLLTLKCYDVAILVDVGQGDYRGRSCSEAQDNGGKRPTEMEGEELHQEA